jgi:hypothetical protein
MERRVLKDLYLNLQGVMVKLVGEATFEATPERWQKIEQSMPVRIKTKM